MWRLLLDTVMLRERCSSFYMHSHTIAMRRRSCCAPSGSVGLLLVLLQVQTDAKWGLLQLALRFKQMFPAHGLQTYIEFLKRKMFKERFSLAPAGGHSIQTDAIPPFCLLPPETVLWQRNLRPAQGESYTVHGMGTSCLMLRLCHLIPCELHICYT